MTSRPAEPDAGLTAGAAAALAREFLAVGVRPGGCLLVHAALRSLGPVPGGAETVIRGLMEALGPEGTLLLPALSYELVTPAAPVFDVLRTPSNVGALPEVFRQRSGTSRSVHPTHSVCAVGPRAAALLGDHVQDDTPVGPRSPFSKLPGHGGQILFLGCGLEPNTSVHGVEELVEPPYLYGTPVDFTLVLASGERFVRRHRPHGFAGVEQRYDRLGAPLEAAGVLRRGRIQAAAVELVEAAPLWEIALAALRRDPWALVDRVTAA